MELIYVYLFVLFYMNAKEALKCSRDSFVHLYVHKTSKEEET